MRQLNVRNVSIALLTEGSGDQLIVFLHGVGADKSCWKQQLSYFGGAGYTCAALDMRGTGDSQARWESGEVLSIDRTEFALDTDAIIHELGFQTAHWVGNSMGGVIIQEAIRLHLSSLDRIVLSNTFAKHPASKEILPRPAKALQTVSLETFARQRIPLTLRPDIEPEILEEAIYAMARKDTEAYLATWRATWSGDYRRILPSIANKTLVIGSDLDQITPLPLSEELHAGIPNSQLAVIRGAGHLPNLDQPAEFNRIVHEFLS